MEPPTTAKGEEVVYRVSTLEVFFDLVFVFAVIQTTGVLTKQLTPLGLFQITLMLGVLWWMYAGYAWLTNTLAPDTASRRLLVLAGMGGFFIVALATPGAFKDTGTMWGVGYLVLVLAHAALFAQNNPHILRVLPGNALAGVLIIVAGLLDGAAVYVLWTLALLIPIGMPFVVPPGGKFTIRATHIVERHGLLFMITLGESIIAVGTGAKGLDLDAGLVAAAMLALALAAAIWWTYFTGDDERAEEALAGFSDMERTMKTMTGYFYAHLPIIIGVIVMAAGIKKAIGHAWEHLTFGPALAMAGGVALYLAGDVLFRRILGIGPSRLRSAGVLAALATVPLGLWIAGVQLAALAMVVAGVLLLEHRARPAATPKAEAPTAA